MTKLLISTHADFRRLWLSQLISAAGDQLFPIAIAALVLDRTGSIAAFGFVLGARALGIGLFAVAGGVWADRVSRRTLMIWADLARGVCVLMLCLFGLAGVPVAVAVGVVFLMGAAQAFFEPAYEALLPELVPVEDLARANAIKEATLRTVSVAGPAAAGFAVAVTSASWALLADGLTFFAGCLLLRRLPATRGHVTERRSMAAEALEGFKAVTERRWVLALMLMSTVHTLLVPAWFVLLPLVSREHFSGDQTYGVLLAAFSLGALPAASVLRRLPDHRRGLRALLFLLPFGGALLALVWWPWLPLVFVLTAAAGFGITVSAITRMSALQEQIPPQVLGRILSLDWLAGTALAPLGFAAFGSALSTVNPAPLITVVVVVYSLTSLAPLCVRGVLHLRMEEPVPAAEDVVAVRPSPGTVRSVTGK